MKSKLYNYTVISLLAGAFLGALPPLQVALGQPKPKQEAPPTTCIEWTKEVKAWGYGYKHLVQLKNQCNTVQRCDITASTNPEKQTADVPPKGAREVIININSPAREFTVSVNCRAAQP